MARTTRSTTALTVRDNAQHIWLAGLGALATASEEGGKVFEDLVEKGAKLEKTGRARLEKVLHKAQGRARTLRGEQAPSAASRPRSITVVATALNKLGIRRAGNPEARRSEELTRTVQTGKKRPARKATRRAVK
jgi:poly(hydroxyalkanoate) granule-associated protein